MYRQQLFHLVVSPFLVFKVCFSGWDFLTVFIESSLISGCGYTVMYLAQITSGSSFEPKP